MLAEFAAKGFDGASTRAIAEHVNAQPPQINYHFDSEEALWEAAVEHLLGFAGWLGATFARGTKPPQSCGSDCATPGSPRQSSATVCTG